MSLLLFVCISTTSLRKPGQIERPSVEAMLVAEDRVLIRSRFPIREVYLHAGSRYYCWVEKFSSDRRMALVRFRNVRIPFSLTVEFDTSPIGYRYDSTREVCFHRTANSRFTDE